MVFTVASALQLCVLMWERQTPYVSLCVIQSETELMRWVVWLSGKRGAIVFSYCMYTVCLTNQAIVINLF